MDLGMLTTRSGFAEGALAKSLYFQFQDRPVTIAEEAEALDELGNKDVRYLRIGRDIGNQVSIMYTHTTDHRSLKVGT